MSRARCGRGSKITFSLAQMVYIILFLYVIKAVAIDVRVVAVMEAINVDIGDRFKNSPEFAALMETLQCRDLFREKNPSKAGFTVLGAQNSRVVKKDTVRRCDFLFAWDSMDGSALIIKQFLHVL